jgi:hypothetical protein
MTDYGTDIAALDDLQDPEVLVSGDFAVAYALARRWLTPYGALAEIGETVDYDSIDVRDWLGQRVDQASLEDLEKQAGQVLLQDPRVLSVDVTVQYSNATIILTGNVIGTNGPFRMVLSVDGVSASLLRVS